MIGDLTIHSLKEISGEDYIHFDATYKAKIFAKNLDYKVVLKSKIGEFGNYLSVDEDESSPFVSLLNSFYDCEFETLNFRDLNRLAKLSRLDLSRKECLAVYKQLQALILIANSELTDKYKLQNS